ncbi:hypothetical protein EDD86DRAFT_245634 [Gorgonomyces haynaldii]|nr:hypothetical protein EDD86DRAFT_245634 [Gorgonomyces haynaldii]
MLLADLAVKAPGAAVCNIQDSKPHLLLLSDKTVLKEVEHGSLLELDPSQVEFHVKINHWRQLKANPERTLLGWIPSASQFLVYDRQGRELFHLSREFRGSDCLLGFEWTFYNELLLVYQTGIELYRHSGTDVTLVKSTKLNIGWYRYCHTSKILLVCTSKNVLDIYRLKWESNLQLLHHLTVQRASAQMIRAHVHLLNLYDAIHVAFLDSTTLSLYEITKKSCKKAFQLNLLQPGSFQFNVWDNLLIAHNMHLKHSLVFDLELSKPQDPAVPPISSLFAQFGDKQWSCFGTHLLLVPDEQETQLYRLAMSNNQFMLELKKWWPWDNVMDYILRRKRDVSFLQRATLLYDAILDHCPKLMLKNMLLSLCSDALKRSIPLVPRFRSLDSFASQMSLQSGRPNGLPGVSADQIVSVAFQEDIVSAHVPTTQAITSILTFVECLCETGHPVQTIVYEFIAKLMVQESRFMQLFQLVQCNFIPDSFPIAKYLLSVQDVHPIYSSMGIAMLLLEAVRYAINRGCIKRIKPIPYLEAAHQSGNPTLFLNVYKCFEEYGVIPLSHLDETLLAQFDPRLPRFVSVYREMWSPQLEMEGIS